MNVSKEVLSLIEDPAFLTAYDAWKKQPITEHMFALAKEVARPVGLPQTTGEAALYYSGMFDACDTMLHFLLDLRGFVERRQQVAEAARLNLGTTYGATMPKSKVRKATT